MRPKCVSLYLLVKCNINHLTCGKYSFFPITFDVIDFFSVIFSRILLLHERKSIFEKYTVGIVV